MTHEPGCPRDDSLPIEQRFACICTAIRAAYRRGYNDHARTVQHWQDTHGAYRIVPLPAEQNIRILRAAEEADVPWNQHGAGENP